MQMKTIPMKEILDDFFFCFSSKPPSASLIASVRTEGILNPLRVIQDGEGVRILAGFKRFFAAREAGIQEAPVRIIPGDADLTGMFYRVLLAHNTHTPFSLIEKARILAIESQINKQAERPDAAILSLLDVPANMKIINEMKALLNFHPNAITYIETYRLSLKQASMFHALDENAQARFAGYGLRENIRPVELAEMVISARDISGRGDREMVELLQDIDLILGRKTLKRDERIKRIKTYLGEKKHPFITDTNDTLEALRSSIDLPANTRVGWDQTLETPGLILQSRLKKPDDIDGLISRLRMKSVNRVLQEMMQVMG